MDQSANWGADSHSPNQQTSFCFLYFVWESVYYYVYKRPPLELNVAQFNVVHSLFLKIYFISLLSFHGRKELLLWGKQAVNACLFLLRNQLINVQKKPDTNVMPWEDTPNIRFPYSLPSNLTTLWTSETLMFFRTSRFHL